MRRMPEYRSSDLGRSLTLLRTFLLASAVILAAGAVALSSRLSGDLREAALADSARDVSAYADAVLAPSLVRDDLGRSVRLPPDVHGLNVYGRDGRLVLSSSRPDRVGRRRTSPDLRAAIETDRPSAEIVDPIGKAPPVVKVWTPLHSSRRTCPGSGRGRARRLLRHRDHRRLQKDRLVRRRGRLRGPLDRPRAARPRRLGPATCPERGSRAALARSRRVLPRARGDAARDDRDAQCGRRGARPVHRRALAARSPRLACDRSGAPLAREAAGRSRDGCALPRHRQDRDAGRDPHQAGPARPRGGDDHARARHPGRGDRRADHLAQRLRPGDPPPPRALGRPRLPGWAERYRHPCRRSDHRDRRRLGRDDDGSPLRGRARRGRSDAPDPGRTREAVQPGGRRRVLEGVAPSARGDPPARRGRRPKSSRSEPTSETRDRCRPSRP